MSKVCHLTGGEYKCREQQEGWDMAVENYKTLLEQGLSTLNLPAITEQSVKVLISTCADRLKDVDVYRPRFEWWVK